MAILTVADNAGVPTVRLTWLAPAANGSPLSAYEIKIETATPGAYQPAPGCDGALAATFAALYCDVAMSALTDSTGLFVLAPGAGIVAVARA
jgi:hypothetical protein